MSRSSQSEKSKISILVNELNRRLYVININVTEEEKVSIVDHFTRQLINSGYNESQIAEIILSSLKGTIKKERMLQQRGKRFLSAAETLSERTRNKLLEATSWYRHKEDTEKDRKKDEDLEPYFKWDDWGLQKNMIEDKSDKGNWRKGVKSERKRVERLKEIIGEKRK